MSTEFDVEGYKLKYIKDKKINDQKINIVKTKLYKAGARDGKTQEIIQNKWSDWSKSRRCMSDMVEDEVGNGGKDHSCWISDMLRNLSLIL